MLIRTSILKSIVLIFSLYTSYVLGVLKQDDVLLKSDVIARLTTLRQFVPQKHYRWHIHWGNKSYRQYGTLEGLQRGQAHWITINFSSGNKLIFDKSNPCFAIYPNKLCLCKLEDFTAPITDLPGVCIHLLAMPFLNWDIVSFSKTAKLGRRAIRVRLSDQDLQAEVFLDKHFNTILQANVWDQKNHFCASFTLKNFKKFKSGWALRTAEFMLNNHKTLLHVDAVETLE